MDWPKFLNLIWEGRIVNMTAFPITRLIFNIQLIEPMFWDQQTQLNKSSIFYLEVYNLVDFVFTVNNCTSATSLSFALIIISLSLSSLTVNDCSIATSLTFLLGHHLSTCVCSNYLELSLWVLSFYPTLSISTVISILTGNDLSL